MNQAIDQSMKTGATPTGGGGGVLTLALFMTSASGPAPENFVIFFEKLSKSCVVHVFTKSNGRKPRRNTILRVGRF